MELGNNQKLPMHFDEDEMYKKHSKQVIYEIRKLEQKKITPKQVFNKNFNKKNKNDNQIIKDLKFKKK